MKTSLLTNPALHPKPAWAIIIVVVVILFEGLRGGVLSPCCEASILWNGKPFLQGWSGTWTPWNQPWAGLNLPCMHHSATSPAFLVLRKQRCLGTGWTLSPGASPSSVLVSWVTLCVLSTWMDLSFLICKMGRLLILTVSMWSSFAK